MQQKEGNFKGTGNFNLYWRCWLPDGQVKAVILVAHGLGEHIARYTNLVNNVVPLGYAVYGLDHQGHGKSEGTRIFIDRFQTYLNDLKTFYDMVRKDNPGKKIILYGHSMGGLIAVRLYAAAPGRNRRACGIRPGPQGGREHYSGYHRHGQDTLGRHAEAGCAGAGLRLPQPRQVGGGSLRQGSSGLSRQNNGAPRLGNVRHHVQS